MEKKQNKYTLKTTSAYLSKPTEYSIAKVEDAQFTLVSYGKEHICSRLSENVIEDGGETVRGWEGTLYMLSSRLEGQCAYEPTRHAQDQAS